MLEQDVLGLVRAGWSSELQAFCENRYLHDGVYKDLILRRGLFRGLDDLPYAFALRRLGRNVRLRTPYVTKYYDGWDELSYESVFEAAWALAEILPPTKKWAGVLYDLLRNCVPPTRPRDVGLLLERWRIEPAEEANDPYGHPVVWLRTCLAGLLKLDDSMLASDDPAVKASYYRRFDPSRLPTWPDRLLADGECYYASALMNERIWRDPGERERLRDLGWKLPDPHSDMHHPNAFLVDEVHNQTMHPEWFVNASEG